MLKSKYITFNLLAATFLLPTTLQARTFDDITESNFIVVGVYKDFAPYSWMNNGTPDGIDVELANRIADGLGVKLKIHWITPDENLEDDLRNTIWKGHYLGGGVADVMLRVPYDKEYSQKRDDIGELVHEQVVMLAPYQNERWQIAFDSQKIEEISTIAVFQYHPIGVEVDSLPAFYMTSAFQGRMRKNTHHYPKTAKAFKAMSDEGEVDAVMGLHSQITWLQGNTTNASIKLAENGFPMMGKQTWDIGIAIQENTRQLGYAIGDIIEDQVTSGKLATWFKSKNITYTKPEYYTSVE